jgi:hypothetical protein
MAAAEEPVDPTALLEPSARERPGSLARDILWVFTRPADLFNELPVCNRAAPALLVLLLVQLAFAGLIISTGVKDYEIETHTQKEITKVRQYFKGEEGAEEKLTSSIDSLEKNAVFTKLMTRVGLLLGGPLRQCVNIGLLAGILFIVVALRGGKPNYQLLLGIAVFAAYVEVPRMLMQVVLISQLQTSRVETSLAAFFMRPNVSFPLYLFLRRFDPFFIWYYVLVGLGLTRTGQLNRRTTIVVVLFLAFLAAVAASASDVMELAEFGAPAGDNVDM